MRNINTVIVAVLVIAVGAYIIRRNQAGQKTATADPPAAAPARSSQENIPPFAGQGSGVPENPLFAILRGAQAEEWAMA